MDALGGGPGTAVALGLAGLGGVGGAALGAALADGGALGAPALFVLFGSPHETARIAIIAERDAREESRDGLRLESQT